MESRQIINGRMFGDERNTSYLPFTAKFEGDIVWPSDSEVVGLAPKSYPLQLFILGEFLYIGYTDAIQCLKKETGDHVWVKHLVQCTRHALDPSGFVTVTPANYLERIDLQGKTVSSSMLLGMTTNSTLVWVSEKDDIIRFVMNCHGSKYVAPGVPEVPRSMMYYRNDREKEQVQFNYARVNEEAHAVCVAEKGKNLYIGLKNMVCCLPVDANDTGAVKELSLNSLLQMSLSHTDALLAVTLEEETTVLHHMPVSGETDWTVECGGRAPVGQPPASTPDGFIFLTAGTTLYAIKEGEHLWTSELPNMGGKIMLTVLADNSVLVQCSHWLGHFSSEGEKLSEKTMAAELSCRPIIDETGHLYTAGKDGIFCFH